MVLRHGDRLPTGWHLGRLPSEPRSGGPEDASCGRCGHHARRHRRPDSSSARSWLRRCRCSGYTGLDSAAPEEH